jgi:hypothetical protein
VKRLRWTVVVAALAFLVVGGVAGSQTGVTLSARPTVSGLGEAIWVSGVVGNGRAGELVDIEAKDCGQDFFRGIAGTTTTDGGAFRHNIFPAINTSLRAVWKGSASAPVAVQKRAVVQLRQRSAKRFAVSVWGANSSTPFWRKYVLFQRFDRRVGAWKTVKRVVLTTSSSSGTEFTASVPKGTLVRAMIPLSQARPCWATGFSRTFRRA